MSKVFIKSSFVIVVWTLISRISGFLRDSIMANYLGTSYIADALIAASKLPNSFRRLLGEGAMSSVFVPIFSGKIAENKKDDAIHFARQIFTIILGISLLVFIVFQLFMPFWIDLLSPGFHKNLDKYNLTITLARINFVFLVTISLSSLCGAMLNSINKFAYFSAMPILLNLGIILAIFCFKSNSTENIAYSVSYATVIIGIIQLIILIIALRKNSINIKIAKVNKTNDIKDFGKKILHGIIGSGIYQINIFVDTIFASMFAGGVSYLYYADRINQLPLTLIGGTLGVALLPTISKYIKLKDIKSAVKLQENCIIFAIILSLFCICTICTFGNEIVSFIYKRGSFSSRDEIIVTRMLTIFSFGYIFSIISKIYNAYIFASGNTKIPMKIGLYSTIVNVIMNYILYKKCGMYCVVYATLASSILSGLLPMIYLYKHKMLSISWNMFMKIIKITICIALLFYMQNIMNGYIHDGLFSLILKLSLSGFTYVILIFLSGVYKMHIIRDLIFSKYARNPL